MRLLIVDNHWVYVENVTEGVEKLISKEFSVYMPGARYIDAEFWDGVIRKYDMRNHRLALPFYQDLVEFLDGKGIPFMLEDKRPPKVPLDASLLALDMLPGITLEEYQMRALRASLENDIGIFSLITGAGKTEVIAGIAKMAQKPTVIIAEQRIVVEQIQQRLKLRKVAEDVGLFYAGKKPDGQTVIVGSIQSLLSPTCKMKRPTIPPKDSCPEGEYHKVYKQYEKKLAKYLATIKGVRARQRNSRILRQAIGKADVLMVDECDRATSDSYTHLFRSWFNGRYRYGFSGTPFEDSKPDHKIRLKERLGRIIATADRKEVQARGRVIPVKYYMIAHGDQSMKGTSETYDIAVNQYVVESESFHSLVCKIATSWPNESCLILVDKDALGDRLEELLPGSKFIHGKTGKKARNKALADFEAKKIQTLIGGKILARGLDLKGGCDNLIITTGGKIQSEFEQKVGRALRKNDRGWSRVFDFMHFSNKYLYSHSRTRLKIMDRLGYETTVIYADGKLSGTELIRRRFHHPRKFPGKSQS